jgi:hypothetical protein
MATRPPVVPGSGDEAQNSGTTSEVEVSAQGITVTVPPTGQTTVINIVTSPLLEARPSGQRHEFDEPDDRNQAFFAQRLSLPVEIDAAPAPPAKLLAPAPSTPRLPEGFRGSLVEEYRGRTRDYLAETNPERLAVEPAPRTSLRTRRVRFASPATPGGLNWVPLGPSVGLHGIFPARSPVSGRVRGIAVSADGQRVYVASANGGVWRSDDAGMTFYPLMNAFDLAPTTTKSDSLACGAIAIDPERPDRVYIGSGETVGEGDAYFGVGVVVSDDGGMRFTTERMQGVEGSGFFALAVDPTDPELAFGAADQGLFRRQPRNQDVAGLPASKPQSYLLRLDTTTGAPEMSYWSAEALTTVSVWARGNGTWNAAVTTLVPFVLKGVPWFVRYVPGLGGNNAWVYEVPPDAAPIQRQNLAWTQNLLLMLFTLGSGVYLVQYDPGTNNATVNRWNDDGTLAVAAAAAAWGAGWTALVPFVLYGVPYFLKYNSAVGNTTQLWRWSSALIPAQVGGAINLPNQAQLVPVEVDGEPLLLVYEPNNNGQTTLYRWALDGTMTQLWQRNAFPAAGVLTPFTWRGARESGPRLLLYVAGTTSLYAWGAGPAPVLVWTQGWPANLIFMPFLMGYEWIYDRTRFFPPPTGGDSDPARPRATSVAVARGSGQTVYFAAFWGRGQIYRSLDRGESWALLGEFPFNKGRIALGVQPSNPRVVYAFTETGEVYRYQIDGGPGLDRWIHIAGTPPAAELTGAQGSYDLTIAVDLDDVDRIYLAGSGVLVQASSTVAWGAAIYRCEVAVSWTAAAPAPLATISMVPSYIGASVHADVHVLTFTPGQPNALWVGCDGGVFYTDRANDARAAGLDSLFEARNTGLSTMTVNGLGQQNTAQPYDAILLIANQDNGNQRYTGAEAWTQAGNLGDSGRVVYRFNNNQQLLATYTHGSMYRSTDAGATFPDYAPVPLVTDANGNRIEPCQFYAPLIAASAFDYLGFGSVRPWVSGDFGATWSSIPTGIYDYSTAPPPGGDIVNWPYTITAMAMKNDGTIVYAGFEDGKIYQYTYTPVPPSWASVRIDNTGGVLNVFTGADNSPNLNPIPITSISLDPTDVSGASIYVTLGGNLSANPNGWQRVWRFTVGAWAPASGGGGGPATQLMNVQFNTIIADPNNVNDLYAGADIGVWASTNNGTTWQPFGEGLPEAPVLDLTIFPPTQITPAAGGGPVSNNANLLRAATHGRGIYERMLPVPVPPARNTQRVFLYVRATILDRGLYDVQTGLPNPIAAGNISYYDGADIKVSSPTSRGFPLPAQITFTQFAQLVDQSTDLQAGRDARVYVQVHNRGAWPGTTVRVTLAFIPAAPGVLPTAVPNLPAGYDATVRAGDLVSGGGWSTLSVAVIDELFAGLPAVVSADISAALLPAVGNYCVLVMVTAVEDPFNPPAGGAGIQNVEYLVKAEPKAAMKYLVVR